MYTKYSGKICYVHKDGKDEEPRMDNLEAQIQYIKDRKFNTENLYLTELRFKNKYKHPITGESTKTACIKDGKDVLGEQADYGTLYWDRYDMGMNDQLRLEYQIHKCYYFQIVFNFHDASSCAVREEANYVPLKAQM
eukprot:UN22121